jgi:hypothetical protein
LQQFLVLVGEITVQCHSRYDLYCCHTCLKKKRGSHVLRQRLW